MKFSCSVFCRDHTYIDQRKRHLSIFDFILEFADIFKFDFLVGDFFYVKSHTFRIDSVTVKTHSLLTRLTGSPTPCRLNAQKMNSANADIHGVNTNKCESSCNSHHFDFSTSLSK